MLTSSTISGNTVPRRQCRRTTRSTNSVPVSFFISFHAVPLCLREIICRLGVEESQRGWLSAPYLGSPCIDHQAENGPWSPARVWSRMNVGGSLTDPTRLCRVYPEKRNFFCEPRAFACASGFGTGIALRPLVSAIDPDGPGSCHSVAYNVNIHGHLAIVTHLPR